MFLRFSGYPGVRAADHAHRLRNHRDAAVRNQVRRFVLVLGHVMRAVRCHALPCIAMQRRYWAVVVGLTMLLLYIPDTKYVTLF